MAQPTPAHLEHLLANIIETVERLEVLMLLWRERPKPFTSRAVSVALGMTPSSTERDLALLCGSGFLAVSIVTDLVYRYTPSSDKLDANVGELVELWSRDRAAVTTLLSASAARTFDGG